MIRIMQSLLLALVALYPVCIFLGLQYFSMQHIGLAALVFFIMRFWLVGRSNRAGDSLVFLKSMVIPVALGGIVLSLSAVILQSETALLLYPCIVSLAGLLSFSWTLFKPPTMIESFARLLQRSDDDFPEEAVCYTRKVTIIWCLFFLLNGVIAFITVIGKDHMVWVLYNGLVSYILMGLLLGGEWIWRKRVLKL